MCFETPGMRKCEGVSKIRCLTLSSSLSWLCLLMCRCSVRFRVEVGIRRTRPPLARVSGCSPAIRKWCNKRSKYPTWNNKKPENQNVSVLWLCVIVCVSCIGVPSGAGCSYQLCWYETESRSLSPFIRYQPVAPRWWTDTLLSKLWELPPLTGKLPVCLRLIWWMRTLDKLPVKDWASITGRFLSDKCFAEEGGGGGITKLNNTCPSGLAICPLLRGPGRGWQLGDGFSSGGWCGGGSCLLNNFSRIPSLPCYQSDRSPFTQNATWCKCQAFPFFCREV